MSIVSGQDSRFQLGLANTWRTPTRARVRLPYTQEGFKGAPTYKEAEALVGAAGATSLSIMSVKSDGSFTTYITPDLAKILFYLALGYEYAPVLDSGQYRHRFVPITAGACANLPSATCEIDRLQEKALYLNYKMTDWKLSGKAEDYLMFECNGPAYKEDIQSVLASALVADYVGATRVVTLAAGVIPADSEYVGKVARLMLACGIPVYGVITASAAAAFTITLAANEYGVAGPLLSTVNDAYNGWTCEILDWEMMPDVPLSTLEYLRFVHGYLYMDDMITPYKALPTGPGTAVFTGANSDTAVNVPASIVGTGANTLTVEAIDPQGVTRLYQYIGAVRTRSTTIITFMDTPAAVVDAFQAIFNAAGALHANWVLAEDQYDEVTDFTVSGDNKIGEAQYGMRGSMYSAEVNPTSRAFSLDLTSRFTTKFSRLRRDRMMTGAPVNIRLEFITQLAEGPLGQQLTSVDSGGHPYKVVIEMKKAYYIEGGANISGPDEPTISPKFTLAETPGVHRAIEITVYDDVNAIASTVTYAVQARADGYTG